MNPPDPEVARLRRLTRRGFAIGGVSALAAVAGLRWVATRSPVDGLPWPLRRLLGLDERLARAAFRPGALAPEFPADRAAEPRVNGLIGMTGEGGTLVPVVEADWRLRVVGPGSTRELTLGAIQALPRSAQTTELKCIEGWSTIVRWGGVRLSDLAASTGLASRSGRPYDPATPPADLLPYVSLTTPDGAYYVGLDAPSALHPQTLLCFERDGRPLSPEHGAPLRLVIPVKYGIKNLKRIGTLAFTDLRPADYWAEQGYDWYAGL